MFGREICLELTAFEALRYKTPSFPRPCLLSLHASFGRYSHAPRRRRRPLSARRYVQVGYPWAAAFEAGRSEPLDYLTALVKQTLRYGMPARRYGRAGAWVVRNALPAGVLRSALRARRTRSRADVDRVLEDVTAQWDRLVSRCPRLAGSTPTRLTALALRRRSAETIFVFGEGREPLVVCKVPRAERASLELEVESLTQAEEARIAPLALGEVGAAFVQEALPGAPLEVQPVTPELAGALPWRDEHEQLADGLIRLAKTTVRPGPPQELRPEVKSALDHADLPNEVRETARNALTDLDGFDIAVLRHGDTSAQNCLFHDGRLSGLVDWEIARPQGAPGFDILNAAVAILDHGVGLVHWSEERAVRCFRQAWRTSEFFARARDAARRSTHAAGGSDADHDKLEIAFFARRLASRVASPESYATGPEAAAEILEVACAR
jgi:hypothetical protein